MGLGKTYSTKYLVDSNGNTGAANQVLVSTATGVDWVDGSGSGIIGGPYLPLAGGTITGNLTVNGTANIGNQLTFPYGSIGDYIYHTGDGDTFYGFPANDTFIVATSGTERMRITAAGNVGIGTTSPGEKLEVSGSNTLSIKLSRNNTDATYVTTLTNNYSSTLGTELKSGIYNILTHGNSTGTALNFTNGAMTFDFRNSEHMRITEAGNVGIGTTSPEGKLQINGGNGQRFIISNTGIGDNQDYGAVAWKNPSGTLFANIALLGNANSSTDGSARLSLGVRAATGATTVVESMTIQSSGNVGIGTTSPSTKLHVAGIAQVAESGNSAFYGGNYVRVFNDQNYGFRNTGGTYIANISMSGNSYFNGGNVGIGTTSPDSLLHVSADVSTAAVTKTGTITIEGRPYGLLGDDIATIDFHNNGNKRSDIRMERGNTADDSQLVFSTSDAGTLNDALIINEIGNVGINNTSPAAKLHTVGEGIVNIVQSSNTVSYTQYYTSSTGAGGSSDGLTVGLNVLDGLVFLREAANLILGTNNTERMRITSAGNVGIGTTSPQVELHVKGNNGWGEVRAEGQTFASGHGASLEFYSEGTALADIYASTDKHLYFRTNGTTERMRILANGNVGIGVTSPNEKLQVGGNINAYINGGIDAGLFASTSAGSTTIALRSNGVTHFNGGNVGIGTTSPTEKLHVAGDIAITNAIGALNFIYSATPTRVARLDSDNGNLRIKADVNGTQANSFISFDIDGGEKMRITSNSNVGIGTTSPAYKLDVSGTGRFSGELSGTSATFSSTVSVGDIIDMNSNKITELAPGSSNLDAVNYQQLTDAVAGVLVYQGTWNASTNTPTLASGVGTPGYYYIVSVAGSTNLDGITDWLPGDWAIFSDQATDVWQKIDHTNVLNGAGTGNKVTKWSGSGTSYTLTDSSITDTGSLVTIANPLSVTGNVGATSFNGLAINTTGINNVANEIVRTEANGYTNFGWINSVSGVTTSTITRITASDDAYLRYVTPATFRSQVIDPYYAPIVTGGYLPLSGGTMTGTNGVLMPDNFKLKFGDATTPDFEIYHNATDSVIENITGDLYITNKADDRDIVFRSDDGAGGFETYFYLDGSSTGTNNPMTVFPDNSKLGFGNAAVPDFLIYHDSNNSYIVDNGTGDLVVLTTRFYVKSTTGEAMFRATENGACDLFHNNIATLSTTSTGIDVSGEIKIDSALLSNQENTDIDTGAEVVAQVAIATYTAAFFDFVVKKTTNVRSGTVYACHDGTNVVYTETSTNDLGDTSDVTLSVDISGGNMRLLATVTSDDWSVKSLIRAI